MAEDGYEDLDELKKELSGKKIEESSISNADLFTAVKGLSTQIVQLTEIFKMAIGQMSQEDDVMKKVQDHLEQLIKNDQDLARGLLLVLEIEKDKRDYQIDKPLTLRRPLLRHRFRRGNRSPMGAPPPLPEGPSTEDLDVEFPSDATGQQSRPGQ